MLQDSTNQVAIAGLLRFSTGMTDGWISLKECVCRMPDGQHDIYAVPGYEMFVCELPFEVLVTKLEEERVLEGFTNMWWA